MCMFTVADAADFATFFDAIYWATISLTTVGYMEAVRKQDDDKG